MKKTIAFMLCLVILLTCVGLSACGGSGKKDLSGSKYLGTWKAVSMSLGNETSPYEDECLLILKADGTADFTDNNEHTACNWEETSGGFKLTGGAKMKFTDDGDGIKSTILGVEVHFVKQ